VFAQIAAVAGAVLIVLYLRNNLVTNLDATGLGTGFAFLDQPTGVDIAGSNFRPSQPIRSALLVGIKNTLALVIVGLPLLTLLGVIVGVARLSTNWLVAKLAAIYVETLRNIPPLLVIFFAFNALFLELPPIAESLTPLGLVVINNRALSFVSFNAREGAEILALVAVLALLGAALVWRWRTVRFDRTGEPHHRVAWGLGIVILVVGVAYFALGRPLGLSRPKLQGLVVTGGISGLAAYFAVLMALVLYTTSHVAEIVRGSIQAVPKGQTEAANALALSAFQRLRFVVLPQAFRIATPPIINQYLNFTKNTSLAIAVGFAEVTRITFQAIGNANPAPQLIAILMLIYLAFSLAISTVSNIINRRFQLVGR
jgi:general L-amino acid transport system permease protein